MYILQKHILCIKQVCLNQFNIVIVLLTLSRLSPLMTMYFMLRNHILEIKGSSDDIIWPFDVFFSLIGCSLLDLVLLHTHSSTNSQAQRHLIRLGKKYDIIFSTKRHFKFLSQHAIFAF